MRNLLNISNLWLGQQSRVAVEPEADGSHFLLQIRDFSEDRRMIKEKQMTRYTPPSVRSGSELVAGDLVFLSRGLRNFAFVIPDSLIEECRPLLAAPYFFVIRLHEKSGVLPSYLSWFLNQESSQRYFQRFGTTGAHMPVVRREELERMPLAIPDLPSQEAIIEIDQLSMRRHDLRRELAAKELLLASTACLRAAQSSSQTDPS